MVNEREVVLDSLLEIVENGELSHKIEKAVLDKYDYLKANEKAFIKRLTEGTIENLLALDEIIDRYAKTPVRKQKPVIRNVLRLSVYQLLFMDKVPASAVCNEAVKLAGKRGFRTLGGFVNGVLRNISRDRKKILKNMPSAMPKWIVDHFTKEFGHEVAQKIIEDAQEEHPVTIRVRKELEKYDDLVPADIGFFCDGIGINENIIPSVYYLKKGKAVKDINGYEDGRFVVQDIASMSVCCMADIKKNDRVLDVCAAPGGKSIQAADMGADVISRDLSESKTDIIRENAIRCKTDNIKLEVFDATVLDENLINSMDVVIADVPCSGLGVLGRKSDIRFKTLPEDLDTLPVVQRQILDTAVSYVKKNGILMYSTCTLNRKENEEQVRYIIENYPFELEKEHLFIPGVEPADGFYVAKLRKK